MSQEYIIKIEDLINRSVKSNPTLNDQYMGNVYSQAKMLINSIISYQNRENRNQNDADIYSLKEIPNIIAFTGRRGTGKTSAMISFAEMLKSQGEAKKILDENNSDTIFYSLSKYIKASMFDKDDYLLRSILAEIYADLKAFYQGNKNRSGINEIFQKIKNQIIDVLQSYKTIKTCINDYNNPENELEAQTSHLSIQKKLCKVIDEFLDLMCNDIVRRSTNRKLIICIDDIDMAFNFQNRIVEDINHFLMIPNVIILVTVKLQNLKLSMQKKMFESISFSNTKGQELVALNISYEQTIEYLRKLIPSDMRITMPSWRKKDYRNIASFVVDTSKYMKLEKLKDCISRPNERISPKELIMFLLARRTNIYLDTQGNKFHFMEPESLRDLNDKFNLFYNMEPVVDFYSEENNALMVNRKILLDYFYFKMKPEFNLEPEEELFVNNLQTIPLERRGNSIWDFYYMTLSKKENKFQEFKEYTFLENEKSRHVKKYYCLGDVFRAIYTASRTDVFSKDLVKYLLASLSFALPTWIDIIEYKAANNRSELEEIEKFYETSLIGNWMFGNAEKNYDLAICCNIKLRIPLNKFSSNELNDKERSLRDETLSDIAILSMASRYSFIDGKTRKSVHYNSEDNSLTFDYIDVTSIPINILYLKSYRNIICECEETESEQIELLFNAVTDKLEKWNIPSMNYLLTNIDMTYNIIKRIILKTIYYSDGYASMIKDPITINSNAKEVLINFCGELIRQVEYQNKIYFPIINENKNEFSTEYIKKLYEFLSRTNAEFIVQSMIEEDEKLDVTTNNVGTIHTTTDSTTDITAIDDPIQEK